MKTFSQVNSFFTFYINVTDICHAIEGVVEIWLTSEDTGAYGKDIGTDIVELLWRIIGNLVEHFRSNLSQL